MTRRDFVSRFLATAAGAAVAHTLDIDRLLWVPGERTIIVPSAPIAGEPLAMWDLVWRNGMRWRLCDGMSPMAGVMMQPVRGGHLVMPSWVQVSGWAQVRFHDASVMVAGAARS